ncbi:hypothetical protein T552_00234 [Pneumocystis carinii B80]|uniref:rRNA biogenesis protein RRP36 n=1 Tax=Pneumocystis carinii (strain B80) TaxID=1408658 RepID=A0A0W4ZT97_PNEC8|nr:hypothetical protein T552_00234 [Pneumocystis carinii B80]KTW31596.1 hypothetical protein T552_00234 [Pneumocystis carinii B80]
MNYKNKTKSNISQVSFNNQDSQVIEKELSKIPFGVLVSVKEELDNASDMKEKHQKVFDSKKQLKINENNKEKIIKKKRTNKNAPLEMSSKKPVSRFRKVVPLTKIERRDPRFDFEDRVNLTNLSSKYSFIKDYQKEELQLLKHTLKHEKNNEKKERIKKTIISMESKLLAAKNKEEATRILHEYKKNEKEKAKIGKKPFFLKKKEQKKLIEASKLSKLEGTKALDRYIRRKDKKLASKERKRLFKYRYKS